MLKSSCVRSRNSKSARSAVVAVTMLAMPAVVSAQGVPAAPAKTLARAPMNSCVRLKFSMSPLVGSPEGLEIYKMQQELAMVGDRMMRVQKADTSDPAFRRVMDARNGVDSVVRFFFNGTDGSGQRTVIIRQMPGGSVTASAGALATGAATPVGATNGDTQRAVRMQIERSQAERMMWESLVREMQPRVDEAVRGSMEMTISVQSTAPGYLGVSTSTSTFPSVLNRESPFGYCDYPRVETVDVGSPAEKVGLAAGDTLLAYNQKDLLQFDVNYNALLQPGKPLQIKFRRDGKVHEVAPTIVPRSGPQQVFRPAQSPCADPAMREECERPRVMLRTPSPLGPQGESFIVRGSPINAILIPGFPGEATLGGAKLQVTTEEFSRNTGAAPGLFVVTVQPNSPAWTAGIRGGEVIVEANGTAVQDVMSLNRAINSKVRERVAVLQVSNKSGLRSVTMKW